MKENKNHNDLPVLYSFRRCPYAMRARLALSYGEICCEIREILLRDKPEEMLALSPKATVPVLQLIDGTVLDESFDIMLWALSQHDPDHWLEKSDQALPLIKENDGPFKAALDRYKYSSRHPEQPAEEYRAEGEKFLKQLDERLNNHAFLLGERMGLADMAIFPFIRQFAGVDRSWFEASPYDNLKNWLNHHLNSALFQEIMHKHMPWKPGDPVKFL